MLTIRERYAIHFETRLRSYRAAMEKNQIEHLILSSGQPFVYYLDDQEAPFRALPHFRHWCPLNEPQHYLLLSLTDKPKLYFFDAKDFWHEHSHWQDAYWAAFFEVKSYDDADALWRELQKTLPSSAFIGQESEQTRVAALGWQSIPERLMAALDWERAVKSDYEIYCLSEANRLGAIAHIKARELFAAGASEFEVHIAFLQALQCMEEELPYPTIVGMDTKSAILHYRQKRKSRDHTVMLIDAGARYEGYCSDITRTYVRENAFQLFIDLLRAMEQDQQQLCLAVQSGVKFLDLQVQYIKLCSDLLIRSGVMQGCSIDFLMENQLTYVFYPHGLGHMLGLQVHDVGGLQINRYGDKSEPCTQYPKLRMRRPLRAGEVVTIEPGLYFIPMRLDAYRQGTFAKYFNWPLIDKLIPLGGIRIEDDVLALPETRDNLTRRYLANEFLIPAH